MNKVNKNLHRRFQFLKFLLSFSPLLLVLLESLSGNNLPIKLKQRFYFYHLISFLLLFKYFNLSVSPVQWIWNLFSVAQFCVRNFVLSNLFCWTSDLFYQEIIKFIHFILSWQLTTEKEDLSEAAWRLSNCRQKCNLKKREMSFEKEMKWFIM